MAKIEKALQNLSSLDELSQKQSVIHSIHPLMALLCTIIYIGVIASFGKYEIISLIPFILYPAIVFSAAQIPMLIILKRAAIILPVILGIGLINLVFDRNTVSFGGVHFYGGFISLISLIIKYGLTVTAALLLIATTGINKLSYALRMLKMPRLLVLQIVLTYRYISVLSEEVVKTTLAYRLRSYGHKGISAKAWGPLTGQILLRTFNRAQNVYRAMNLRGFNGDYHPGKNVRLSYKDGMYLLLWILFFTAARIYNIPEFLGSFF